MWKCPCVRVVDAGAFVRCVGRCSGDRSWGCLAETATKPQRAPKNRNMERTERDKRIQRGSGTTLCAAMVSDDKRGQAKRAENSLYRIGKDEVPSSNLGSSSTKCPLFTWKVVISLSFCNYFWRFEFQLLPLTTEPATDRKKTGLRGRFALGGLFVQLAGFCCFACSFPAAISAFISQISSASFFSHSASVFA